MSDAVELDESHTSAKIELDAATLASTLTDIYVQQGKTEADFPMDIKAYFRVKAQVVTSTGAAVEGTEIMSNIVSLNKIHLLFSLPPVTTPDNVYVIGKFCGWDWGKCLDMIKVNGAENVFWRLVYIDGEGIKINTDKSWNGKDLGYSGIKISGDCKDDLTDNGGNIASKNPGWYLMIVTTSVSGRDIIYDVQFNKPEVWLTGGVLNGVWDELNPAGLFTVPTTQDGEFVSPAFLAGVSGGKTSDDPGVRAYVKIPGYDWWKSEFIIYDGKIAYRSTGGDQTPRVAGKVGQQLHLNFAKGTGEIK